MPGQFVSRESIKQIDQAFKLLFNSRLSLKHAIEKVENELVRSEEIAYLINFSKNSERGLVRSCR